MSDAVDATGSEVLPLDEEEEDKEDRRGTAAVGGDGGGGGGGTEREDKSRGKDKASKSEGVTTAEEKKPHKSTAHHVSPRVRRRSSTSQYQAETRWTIQRLMASLEPTRLRGFNEPFYAGSVVLYVVQSEPSALDRLPEHVQTVFSRLPTAEANSRRKGVPPTTDTVTFPETCIAPLPTFPTCLSSGTWTGSGSSVSAASSTSSSSSSASSCSTTLSTAPASHFSLREISREPDDDVVGEEDKVEYKDQTLSTFFSPLVRSSPSLGTTHWLPDESSTRKRGRPPTTATTKAEEESGTRSLPPDSTKRVRHMQGPVSKKGAATVRGRGRGRTTGKGRSKNTRPSTRHVADVANSVVYPPVSAETNRVGLDHLMRVGKVVFSIVDTPSDTSPLSCTIIGDEFRSVGSDWSMYDSAFDRIPESRGFLRNLTSAWYSTLTLSTRQSSTQLPTHTIHSPPPPLSTPCSSSSSYSSSSVTSSSSSASSSSSSFSTSSPSLLPAAAFPSSMHTASSTVEPSSSSTRSSSSSTCSSTTSTIEEVRIHRVYWYATVTRAILAQSPVLAHMFQSGMIESRRRVPAPLVMRVSSLAESYLLLVALRTLWREPLPRHASSTALWYWITWGDAHDWSPIIIEASAHLAAMIRASGGSDDNRCCWSLLPWINRLQHRDLITQSRLVSALRKQAESDMDLFPCFTLSKMSQWVTLPHELVILFMCDRSVSSRPWPPSVRIQFLRAWLEANPTCDPRIRSGMILWLIRSTYHNALPVPKWFAAHVMESMRGLDPAMDRWTQQLQQVAMGVASLEDISNMWPIHPRSISSSLDTVDPHVTTRDGRDDPRAKEDKEDKEDKDQENKNHEKETMESATWGWWMWHRLHAHDTKDMDLTRPAPDPEPLGFVECTPSHVRFLLPMDGQWRMAVSRSGMLFALSGEFTSSGSRARIRTSCQVGKSGLTGTRARVKVWVHCWSSRTSYDGVSGHRDLSLAHKTGCEVDLLIPSSFITKWSMDHMVARGNRAAIASEFASWWSSGQPFSSSGLSFIPASSSSSSYSSSSSSTTTSSPRLSAAMPPPPSSGIASPSLASMTGASSMSPTTSPIPTSTSTASLTSSASTSTTTTTTTTTTATASLGTTSPIGSESHVCLWMSLDVTS